MKLNLKKNSPDIENQTLLCALNQINKKLFVKLKLTPQSIKPQILPQVLISIRKAY